MANRRLCEIDLCGNKHTAKGLCAKHYIRSVRHGSPTGGGTSRRPRSTGICSVLGCTEPHRARGVCYKHYKQWEYHGLSDDRLPRVPVPTVYLDGNGYRCFRSKGHPAAEPNGRVLEHRAVMVEKLGRPLLKGENVHHLNGDRADNRPENLELWVTLQPSGQRPEDLVAYAREIIARYA